MMHRRDDSVDDDDDSNFSDPGGLDISNVFVKYLPQDVDDATLHTMFSPFGEILSCKVMVDHQTSHSLGYGFVRFANPDAAQSAIKNMSGQRIANKTLLCKLSNSSAAKAPEDPSNNLYIKPLLLQTTEEQLRAMFQPFGNILDCKVMVDRNTGMSRQIGFVRFEHQYEAARALAAMNDTKLDINSPPLIVKYAESEVQKATRKQRQQAARRANGVTPRGRSSAEYPTAPTFRREPDVMRAPGPGPVRNVFDSAPSPHRAVAGFSPRYPPAQPQDMYAPQPPPPMQGASPLAWGGVPPPEEQRASPRTAGMVQQQVPPQVIPEMTVGGRSVSPSLGDDKYNPYSEGVNLFVFHLPSDVDDGQLYRLFSPFGALESVKVILDRTTGESRGYGFVKYYRMADAVTAIHAMNGYQINSKHLKVSFKTNGKRNRAAEREMHMAGQGRTSPNTGRFFDPSLSPVSSPVYPHFQLSPEMPTHAPPALGPSALRAPTNNGRLTSPQVNPSYMFVGDPAMGGLGMGGHPMLAPAFAFGGAGAPPMQQQDQDDLVRRMEGFGMNGMNAMNLPPGYVRGMPGLGMTMPGMPGMPNMPAGMAGMGMGAMPGMPGMGQMTMEQQRTMVAAGDPRSSLGLRGLDAGGHGMAAPGGDRMHSTLLSGMNQ